MLPGSASSLQLNQTVQGFKKCDKDGQGHSTASVQETVKQEGALQPGDEMTEKSALMSARARVSRGQFSPCFPVQESQAISKSDDGRLRTNERR